MLKPALLELLYFFNRLPVLHSIVSSADIAALFYEKFWFFFVKNWRNRNLCHHMLVLEV